VQIPKLIGALIAFRIFILVQIFYKNIKNMVIIFVFSIYINLIWEGEKS